MNGIPEVQTCEDVHPVKVIIGTEQKRCPKCKKIKLKSSFHKNKAKPDGLCTECKSCHCKATRDYNVENKEKISKQHKKYVKKNRPRIRIRHKRWRDNNKDKVLGYTFKRKKVKSEYDKNWWQKLLPEEKSKKMQATNKNRDKFTENNPELIIYRTAKKRAQRNNMIFDLDIQDICIPDVCPVLGIKLNKKVYKKGTNQRLKDCRPSIDRIDNNLGYIQSNIIIISLRANRLKSDATSQEITALARWMNTMQRKKENIHGN